MAQQDNRRCYWVKASSFSLDLAANELIVTSSIKLTDSKPVVKDLGHYFEVVIDTQFNTLYVKTISNSSTITLPDSIQICYRVLPSIISKKYFNRSELAYDTGYYYQKAGHLPISQDPKFNKSIEREQLFTLKGIGTDESIQKTGSLSRGISFGNGNGQDVGVISALNLQLEGKLTPDLDLTAVITDQNVPFQPEGNTQQLQDFDQVLIQLKHKNGLLAAGDIVMQQDSASYFLRYYKNVQGAQLEASFSDSTNWNSKTSIGLSAAKGQFNSDSVVVIEGVQGPYRLRGANNERFITILANSERVFLDGKRLKRGFDFDYIIDYNTAELTFTNQVLISKFSRVRVDFEYATQNYSRSIVQAQHTTNYKKWGISMGFYREKDNINSPLLAQLSELDRQILSLAGDDPLQAVAPTAQVVESFNTNQILYYEDQQEVDGVLYTFFTRALNDNQPLFSVIFSEVGLGNGNYIETQPTANGRVYEWVAPVNGIAQGEFEPVRQLPLPNQRQMFNLQASYDINKSEQLFVQTAFSLQDKNLFSSIDASDDKGKAIRFGYLNKGKKSRKWKSYEWLSGISLELDEQDFQVIDRFRSIEFDRDWALEDRKAAADRIINGFVGLKKNSKNHFQYQLSHRKRGQAVDGFQHQATFNKELGKLGLANELFLLHSDREASKASWKKLHSVLSWKTDKLLIGYDFQLDDNTISNANGDSILRTIMNFKQHQGFIQNGDSLAFKFRFDHTFRKDFLPINGRLVGNTQSQTSRLNLNKSTTQSRTNLTLTYRLLENLQQADNRYEETIMGRIDWDRTVAKKSIRSNFSLSTSAARELKREFFFLPVDVGQGTHTWRDDNSDGIQDLNEFYEAINPEERQFAKFFQPTDEYIQAFNTLLNYQLHLNSPKSWRKTKGVKHILSKLSSITSVQISKRTTDKNPIKRLSPFNTAIAKEDLLSNRSTIRNTLFYNRRNPKFGLELQFLTTNNKQLLTNGFQESTLTNIHFKSRVNFSKKSNLELDLSRKDKSNQSDVFSNQNFDIKGMSAQPTISYQFSKSARISTAYQYQLRKNKIGNSEQSIINELSLAMRLSKKARNTLNTRFEYIHIKYSGETNSGVGYELLQALQPGTTIRWEFRWSQRLSNGLQLTAIYNGRKSGSDTVIHLGRVQATALF